MLHINTYSKYRYFYYNNTIDTIPTSVFYLFNTASSCCTRIWYGYDGKTHINPHFKYENIINGKDIIGLEAMVDNPLYTEASRKEFFSRMIQRAMRGCF